MEGGKRKTERMVLYGGQARYLTLITPKHGPVAKDPGGGAREWCFLVVPAAK